MFNIDKIKPEYSDLEFYWTVNFNDSCLYTFPNPQDIDQYDWSKICGITFNPIFRGNKNSTLFGWRNNDGQLEIVPYLNNNEGEYFFEEQHIQKVSPNVDISLKIKIDILNHSVGFYIDNVAEIYAGNNMFGVGDCFREVNSWFGGTDPAPHYMWYEKSKMNKLIYKAVLDTNAIIL